MLALEEGQRDGQGDRLQKKNVPSGVKRPHHRAPSIEGQRARYYGLV